MKIQPIHTYNNFATLHQNKTQKKENSYITLQTQTFNSINTLDRSFIMFKGVNNEFDFEEPDEKFLNIIAQNLRLSSKEKDILNTETANFFKTNKLNSFDDIEEDLQAQGKYLEIIVNKLNLSDFDFNIIADELVERTDSLQDYNPQPKKYQKDYEVIESILDNYNFDTTSKLNIFEVMEKDAANSNADTIFENFKNQKELTNSNTFKFLATTYNENIATDICIDMGLAANKDAKTRHANIDKTKIQKELYIYATNIAITDKIIEHFELNEEEGDYINDEIAKRNNENKNIYQIAYELSEKYKLPGGAEKFIIETIKIQDSVLDELRNVNINTLINLKDE